MRVEGLQKQAAAMREFPMFGSLLYLSCNRCIKRDYSTPFREGKIP